MGLGGLGSAPPAPAAPPAPTDDAPEAGQVAYEALAEFIDGAPGETVSQLVGAIQAGTPWERLPLKVQQACAEFEGMLFDDDAEAEV